MRFKTVIKVVILCSAYIHIVKLVYRKSGMEIFFSVSISKLFFYVKNKLFLSPKSINGAQTQKISFQFQKSFVKYELSTFLSTLELRVDVKLNSEPISIPFE